MPALTNQTETRCRILGIDGEGLEHVHDKTRNRIVAIDDRGIDVQLDLDAHEGTLSDWMQYVAERRGWMAEQWVGYRWKNALADAGGVIQ